MSVSTASQNVAQCDYLKEWSFVFRLYALYALAAIGIPANILSFIVLVKKYKESICFFLVLLAISDTLALVLEILGRSPVGDISDASCAGVHYTRYFLKFMSHFLILMASIEICHKILKTETSATSTNVRRVILQAVIVLVYSLVANCYMFVTQGINGCHQCNAKAEYAKVNLYCYLFLNFVPMEVLTSAILIICAIISIIGMSKKRKQNPAVLQHLEKREVSLEKQSEKTKITPEFVANSAEPVSISDWAKMMMVVMVMFVLLRLPASCAWLYDYIHYQVNGHPNDWDRYYLMHAINVLSVVSAANFAIKFFIYVCFSRFRRHLVETVIYSNKSVNKKEVN